MLLGPYVAVCKTLYVLLALYTRDERDLSVRPNNRVIKKRVDGSCTLHNLVNLSCFDFFSCPLPESPGVHLAFLTALDTMIGQEICGVCPLRIKLQELPIPIKSLARR